MRIGIQLPSFSYPDGPAAIGPTFARIAREADQGGLDSFWVMDHFFQIGDLGAADEPMLEGWSALAYAAALTERITLGTLVTGVVYRYPAVLVKTVTTLDVLSGGRAWLGIGAAWNQEEAVALGLPFPPFKQRFEQLEETLEIARRMWTGDESPYRGQHFQLERPMNSPPALSTPHPKVMIGGAGEKKTLRLVAQRADACNIADSPELPRKLEVLAEHCEREGRPYAEIEKTTITLVPAGAGVEQIVDIGGRLRDAGIEHVIFSCPAAHEPGAVDRVAEAARAL